MRAATGQQRDPEPGKPGPDADQPGARPGEPALFGAQTARAVDRPDAAAAGAGPEHRLQRHCHQSGVHDHLPAELPAKAGRIVVAVEDRGPGIAHSEHEKVFEPFYRIEGSRNPGGVGLGLAVARSIAREHGGDIVLATRKGGGLSARLELPA
ncbi:MAG TPA: sensor histidine kinase [Stellaceae bacterium]